MNIIPEDVGNNIINYLCFSSTIYKLFFINKWWNKLIKNSKFLNNYKMVQNKFKMYLEDSRTEENEKLLHLWTKYNNWKWKKDIVHTFKKGVYVDVLDKVNTWGHGIIKKSCIKIMNNVYEKKFEIEFLGWSDNYNEQVSITKIEAFGTMCPCPINLYESLKTQKENTWLLHRKINMWKPSKVKTMEVNMDNIIVKIDHSLVKIKKEDINNILKICTNATSMLAYKKSDLIFRNFKY